jgi:hypothetical protein
VKFTVWHPAPCGRIPLVSRLRFLAVIPLTLVALLLLPQPAAGAEGNRAYLYDLDSTGFPQIRVYFSAADPLGGRPTGLAAGDIDLKEDGSPARGVMIVGEQTGLRLVVVIDPGMDLLYTLPGGETRIDLLRRTMTDWLGGLPQAGIDDLTLITPEGASVSHSADRDVFLSALRSYTPQLPAQRTLDSMLVDALGAAGDPKPRPGMRAFLLVFSASKLSQRENIGQGLCARAAELHAPLYGIWSARKEPSAKPDMDALASIASQCGGYSVALESSTGSSTMLAMIATQRAQYRIDYRSSVASSGQHSLGVTVKAASFQAESSPLLFSVDVQPPAVAWVNFPDRLVRAGSGVSQPVEEYHPTAIDLKAEVTFPDGHPRPIVSMQLFADDKLAAECPQAPCLGVRWDLRDYSRSGTVALRLAVHDDLGLEGQTPERKLSLEVRRPSFGEVFRAYYLLPLIIALSVAAAGGVLIAAIANLNRVRTTQAAGELLFPPALRPFPPRWTGGKGLWQNITRARRRTIAGETETYAILEPLGGDVKPLAIAADDVLLGRDGQAAAIVLDDPSVSPRHARIARMGDGAPWVFDLGSTAGSWINFEEIPPEGAPLRDGDRLNFGRMAFRVRLKPPPQDRQGNRPAAEENTDDG